MKKIFIFIIPLFLLSESFIYDAFKDEIKKESIDFEIVSDSYAEFDFVGGFADGKYKLKDYNVSYLKDNIYKLHLLFEKRKKIFRYIQKPVLYFWYKDDKILFLSDKGKYRYRFKNDFIEIKKDKDVYRFYKKRAENLFVIPVKGGKIYLKVVK